MSLQLKAMAWTFEEKAIGPEAKAIKVWPRGHGLASRTTLLKNLAPTCKANRINVKTGTNQSC